MKLAVKPVNRWCTAVPVRRCSPQHGIRQIVEQRNVQGEFVHTSTPIPAYDQTHFHVSADGESVQVAVAPYNQLGKSGEDQSVEMFFDPLHDHIGFEQFIFPSAQGAAPQVMHHLPYADAASTAYPRVRLLEWAWHDGKDINFMGLPDQQRYLVARFGRPELFRHGRCCGFNVTRYRNAIREPSSWNLCSGIGFVDATSFGHLYIGRAPAALTLEAAELNGTTLTLSGRVIGGARGLTLDLADPHDHRKSIRPKRAGDGWQARCTIDPALAGRYRLYPRVPGGAVEPLYFDIDVPARKRRPFALGMFYDIPDDLRCNYFTPQRLESQVQTLNDWGINRLYWIHYGPLNRHKSWWDAYGDRKFVPRTYRECGDILGLVSKQAHRRDMEVFATFKPFDMGGNWATYDKPARDRLPEIENRYCAMLDEVMANLDATMRRYEPWHRPWSLPISRLVLCSETKLPALRRRDLRLWVSVDNRKYRRYPGEVTLRQSVKSVPHCRWTPAGVVEEPGTRRQWQVELTGLNIRQPYLAVEIAEDQRDAWRCTERRFLVAQAFDSLGRPVTPALGDSGDLDKGFKFNQVWPGWANQTEKVLDHYVWTSAPLGMAFVDRAQFPFLLEPCDPRAQRVWLQCVDEALDSGVDGVDIRILCHHIVCHSWLTYAFAPSVLDQFRGRFGRDPEPRDEDYHRIRLIRGEAITQFLRDAKALTKKRGRKLAIHLEPGVEVPPHLHTRMQIHLDWRRWIEEGIADEITGKYWGSQNRWLHENVLPLAKRHGVPVHLCDMNFTLNQITGVERATRLATEARDAGLDGFAYYETVSYLKMNAAGQSLPLAHADKAIRSAAYSLEAR